jgi:hypothetical protein
VGIPSPPPSVGLRLNEPSPEVERLPPEASHSAPHPAVAVPAFVTPDSFLDAHLPVSDEALGHPLSLAVTEDQRKVNPGSLAVKSTVAWTERSPEEPIVFCLPFTHGVL